MGGNLSDQGTINYILHLQPQNVTSLNHLPMLHSARSVAPVPLVVYFGEQG